MQFHAGCKTCCGVLCSYVKLKTEGFPLSSTKLPPSPPVRSSSFLLSSALKGHSLFGDASSCNAYQKPKLPIFSGEEKSETSFENLLS
jgi:hypothetical protein